MSDELITINVWLAGRSYRIRIKAHEEETVRKAIKRADERIMELRNHYAGKDDQDFVAMCLLTYAADNAIESLGMPFLQDELNVIAEKIDKVLNRVD
ncbi:MAG TPA: cell division protein ZapA [Flavipsychrobacter sp.]|nr:cell division protein ZapA [Flavipsychrobacter sp.]